MFALRARQRCIGRRRCTARVCGTVCARRRLKNTPTLTDSVRHRVTSGGNPAAAHHVERPRSLPPTAGSQRVDGIDWWRHRPCASLRPGNLARAPGPDQQGFKHHSGGSSMEVEGAASTSVAGESAAGGGGMQMALHPLCAAPLPSRTASGSRTASRAIFLRYAAVKGQQSRSGPANMHFSHRLISGSLERKR